VGENEREERSRAFLVLPTSESSRRHALALKKKKKKKKKKKTKTRPRFKNTLKTREKKMNHTHMTVPTTGAIPNTVTSNHPPPTFFAMALNASRPKDPMISTLFEEMP